MLTAGLTPPSAPGQDLQSLRPWRRTTKRRQRKEAATQIANVLLQQLGLNGSGRTLSDPQNKRLSSSKPSAGRQAVVIEAASSPSHLTIFASLPPFITISLFSAERGLKMPGSVTYFPVKKKKENLIRSSRTLFIFILPPTPPSLHTLTIQPNVHGRLCLRAHPNLGLSTGGRFVRGWRGERRGEEKL